MADRNSELLARFRAGEPIEALARAYGLTRQRIYQIATPGDKMARRIAVREAQQPPLAPPSALRHDPDYRRIVLALQARWTSRGGWHDLADAYDAATAWRDADIPVEAALQSIAAGQWLPSRPSRAPSKNTLAARILALADGARTAAEIGEIVGRSSTRVHQHVRTLQRRGFAARLKPQRKPRRNLALPTAPGGTGYKFKNIGA